MKKTIVKISWCIAAALTAILLMQVSCMEVYASKMGRSDEGWEWDTVRSSDDPEAVLTGCPEDEENITDSLIPEYIHTGWGTKKVIGISSWVFRGNTKIKTVNVSGEYFTEGTVLDFTGCTKLQEVYVPKNCKVQLESFAKCVNLQKVVIDKDNPYCSYEDGVFYNKDKTEIIGVIHSIFNKSEMEIPDSVTTIRENAFYGCSELTSITFGEASACITIGASAFSMCDALKNIKLPKTLETIEEQAFKWCSALEKIELPQNIDTLGDDTFAYCTSLKEIVLPEKLTCLGHNAFKECESLENVQIKGNIERIPSGMFSGCTNLKNIKIESSNIRYIADYAFGKCINLQSIEIPESVGVIDKGAFADSGVGEIIGKKGSYAQQWAEENDIKFIDKNQAETKEKLIKLIPVIVAAAVIVLVAIVVLVICRKRRKSKKIG